MRYDDFIVLGSETAVKAEGKYVQKGKEYVVEDGDIILFRFNVSNTKKWLMLVIPKNDLLWCILIQFSKLKTM